MQRLEVKDLYWAAGFLEGEGSFGNAGGAAISEVVRATQGHRPPLDLLQAMFGGRIRPGMPQHNQQPFFIWHVSGEKARGVMLTLYPLLSPKRQEQVRSALANGPKKGRPRGIALRPT